MQHTASRQSEAVAKLQKRELRLVLVTPARNEACFIKLTIDCVVAQRLRPIRWVIVSDGSTDGTDEIVRSYAARYPWIELVRMPERKERHFAGKVHAFNAGYACLRDINYDVIGCMDGDISFDEEYFEYLLGRLSERPSIGLVGSAIVEGDNLKPVYDYRFVGEEHVSGICQLFRRECFEDIGGYVAVKGGGVDKIAVISARFRGWETKTFTELTCRHRREMGGAQERPWKARFRYGTKDYAFGNAPVWQLFRVLYQMTKRPYLIGGVALGLGYMFSLFSGAERPVSPEMVTFHRREQMYRLRRFFVPFKISNAKSAVGPTRQP